VTQQPNLKIGVLMPGPVSRVNVYLERKSYSCSTVESACGLCGSLGARLVGNLGKLDHLRFQPDGSIPMRLNGTKKPVEF